LILPLLFLVVLATSLLSGVIGMGGGVALVGVMAAMLEAPLVVPVHGVLQLVGNSARWLLLWRRVRFSLLLLYAPGLVAGVALAMRFYRGAELPWFRPLVGVFVLAFLAWDRFKPRRLVLPLWVFLPAGFIGGVLSMLVGASGPYLAAFFLRDDMDREEIVATKAALQSFGHLLKIPAFLSLGFDYTARLDLILPLTAAALLGTYLGTRLLKRLDESAFRLAFRLLLGLLGLRLVAAAWI